MQAMKVALLPSWYPPYGGEFFENQAQELALQGLEVSVLAPRIESVSKPKRWLKSFISGISREQRNDVAVYRWCVPRLSRSVHEMPVRTVYTAEKLFQTLCRYQGKPDLIHAHSAMWAGYAAACIAQKYAVPFVLTEHRSRFNFAGEGVASWMTPYFSLAYRNATKVLLVGSLLANGIKPFWDEAHSAEVLSNGVHTEKFTMSAPRDDGKFHFLFAGTLNYRKGIDLLIAAMQDLARKYDKVMLHVAGEGPLKEKVKQQVQASGLQERVRFYGNMPHDRLAELMATMHAFVLPTRYDAQGVVFLEAMSCGLPIIATEGAPPEICPVIAGMRIPVDNFRALTAAMLELMLNYATYDRYAIRRYAIERFDFKVVTARLVSIYNEILKNRTFKAGSTRTES